MGSDIRRDCIFVRIETGADGWALCTATLEAIGSVPWLAWDADLKGMRGVIAGDASVVARIGAWVSTLPELGEVEVRENVCLVSCPAPWSSSLARLSQGEHILALFGATTGLRIAVEAEAAAGLAEALREEPGPT